MTTCCGFDQLGIEIPFPEPEHPRRVGVYRATIAAGDLSAEVRQHRSRNLEKKQDFFETLKFVEIFSRVAAVVVVVVVAAYQEMHPLFSKPLSQIRSGTETKATKNIPLDFMSDLKKEVDVDFRRRRENGQP